MNKHFFELPKAVKRAVWAALMAEWAKKKAAHGKRPTEKGNKKEVGAAAGRVYLFFRVILPGRSFFRGVVRGGRLESIAGHSFPRGVHDIPRHAFPGVGGGCVQILFNFFRDSN